MITYHFSNLTELANYFSRKALNELNTSNTSVNLLTKHKHRARAQAYDNVAYILSRTTLEPNTTESSDA